MIQNVLVSIRGIQHEVADGEAIESIQPGSYRRTKEKHVILYEEILEESLNGQLSAVKCIMKIGPDYVSIVKKGEVETEMFFKKGESYTTFYDTPMGTMSMGISTNRLEIREHPDSMHVCLDYSLEINYSHISTCTIDISISFLN